MAELESTYPLFEWNKSNGMATAAQTRKAYTAASEQGQCVDFSRYVWNDIVDTVAQLQEALGLSWDGKYTTRDGAKITRLYGPLTSKAFNSVRHNIQAVAFTTWAWQFDFLREGYVGRNDFRGAATYGSNADQLNGWYIIELVRKLNVAIELMRGTYPTEELGCADIAKSETAAELPVRPALPLPAVDNGTTKTAAETKVILTVGLPGRQNGESDATGVLRALPMIGLPATGQGEGTWRSALGLIRLIGLPSSERSTSEAEATFHPAPAPGLAYMAIRKTPTATELVASIRTVPFRPWQSAVSEVAAVLTEPVAIPLQGATVADSGCVTAFFARQVDTLRTITKAASAVAANFDALRLENVEAASAAHSAENTRFDVRDPIPIHAKEAGRSNAKGAYVVREIVKIYGKDAGGSRCASEIAQGVPRPVKAAASGVSEGSALFVPVDGTRFVGKGKGASKAAVYMVGKDPVFLPWHREASATAGTATFFGADAVHLTPTVYDRKSCEKAEIATGESLPVAAAKEIASQGKGTLLYRRPIDATGDGKSTSDAKAEITWGTPTTVEGTAVAVATERAMLMAQPMEAVGGKTAGHSNGVAMLTFIIPEKDWYDPVQVGSNLYIRSAWLFWRDGDKGYIDVAEFYTPVQTGDNLYIRSAWFSYQDQDGAFIDTDVFYAPVQAGDDLYIRSANRFWTDGSSGNIDTDVFLEPVQDGSNLYIRQNIFGGD